MTGKELAKLAFRSATFLAVIARSCVKLELYYLKGHFIELSYRKKKLSENVVHQRLYDVNHFPDSPDNTSYLTIYLTPIKLF